MIRFKALTMYCVLVLATALLLAGVSRIEDIMAQKVEEHHLRFTGQVKNAPPLVAFTTVALGSFRGLIADLLWMRAGSLQEKGNYFEMVQLARWLVDLQPSFAGATQYLAWNMAYNISVTCSDPADRWRWVNEGIKLLRDRALEYNPEEPLLYRELGWIFQHKMGNTLDDAHQYYKNQFALQIIDVLGYSDPDWEALAAAPVGAKGFDQAYPADSLLRKAMQALEIEGYDALYADYKKEKAIPAALVKQLGPGQQKLLDALVTEFKADWLRERFKLDARVAVKIDRKYGNLDWRTPEAQAVYWATLGLEKTPSHRNLECERMITQALYESFRHGRILMIDDKDFANIVVVPNLNVVDAVLRTYQETYEANEQQSTFRSAKINFIKEAIAILYNYGRFSKAEEYYRELRREEPNSHPLPLDEFVLARWAENVRDASVKQATTIISGLVYRGIYYMVYGDDEAAAANERIARFIYSNYEKENADVKQRVGLMSYAEIKRTVVENCLRTFSPTMVMILREKLAQEMPELKNAKPLAPQPFSLPGGKR